MSGFANEAYAQVPDELGLALAARLRGLPPSSFLPSLEAALDELRTMLLDQGYSSAATYRLCRDVRHVACEVWQRPSP